MIQEDEKSYKINIVPEFIFKGCNVVPNRSALD